ncbi:MAG: hypothetical protein J3R72DRAFT_475335 [Linnemannia gamsii]|nr:MAG: hypothetical protein J3R72DRAFT_475335 [Linnemannia gamsii]
MFKSILLVGIALAASLVVEAKPDLVFSTGTVQQGDQYRCEELDYQVCYSFGNTPPSLKSLAFTNYDFPKHKDFSITVYDGPDCNNYYDRWSFKQSDDGRDVIAAWFSLQSVRSFQIANFQTSQVKHGYLGSKSATRDPKCWRE